MKAKDLTQADVGKWVTLRGEIVEVRRYSVAIQIEDDLDRDNDETITDFYNNTILEFTTPPEPVHEVGDIVRHINNVEWTIAAIDGNACLLRYLTGHISADYPLDPGLWKFVRKGNVA